MNTDLLTLEQRLKFERLARADEPPEPSSSWVNNFCPSCCSWVPMGEVREGEHVRCGWRVIPA